MRLLRGREPEPEAPAHEAGPPPDAERSPEAERPPEHELAAAVERLHEAEATLGDLDHDLIVLAARETELHEQEVEVDLGTRDPGEHERALGRLEVELEMARRERDRKQRLVAGLTQRCADLAQEIGRQAEAKIAERLAASAARIEQLEASLRDERRVQANDEERLREAREATLRARSTFDKEAAKWAGERDRQESERIRSWARMPAWRLDVEQLSPATLAKIEAERERLERDREAAKGRNRQLAATSWQDAEVSLGGTRPEFLDG